jgi:hypothetical protein
MSSLATRVGRSIGGSSCVVELELVGLDWFGCLVDGVFVFGRVVFFYLIPVVSEVLAVQLLGFHIRLYRRLRLSVAAFTQLSMFDTEWILFVIPQDSSTTCQIWLISLVLLFRFRVLLIVMIIWVT